MNTLLIFFALPIAVIIISAILQKSLKNPIAVAALIFAIFLIVTFAAFDETFLIATLIYTVLALITALIVRFICESNNRNNNNLCELLNAYFRNANTEDVLNNVSNNCNTNNETVLNTVSDILNTNNSNNNNNSCGCSRYRRYR